jgi:DNA-binding NarL/FixJ family response regulator
MKRIKVLLAEDHTIVREGLRLLLALEKDMEIICEAENGRRAVELAIKEQPDVVLMDIAMPLLNGLEAARQILQNKPSSRILLLSAHDDDGYVEHALALGISGFVVKQTSATNLANAVRIVANGKPYFSPTILKRLSQFEKSVDGSTMSKGKSFKLTTRETEVLQLIAEGLANKQTASELGISIKTVEKHRQALMDKLQVHDTAGLTRYAIASGVIESSIQNTVL